MKTATVTPYGAGEGKKRQVRRMFDAIAGRYDLLNRVLSLGVDVWWRRRAVAELRALKPQKILDLATGTGDFALAALRLKPQKIVGLDLSEGMLAIGRKKTAGKPVEMILGDAENLPFADGEFDAVTVGFGVRNFENLERGLSEMARVLRSGGKAVVLEPSTPKIFPFNRLFRWYFHVVLPRIGAAISRDKAAYAYLPESVRAFPHGDDFLKICLSSGFSTGVHRPLTLGICSMYVLTK
ncbi:MAG: bifunctional demethylmenaquinone methyltransferase/2-methoxy-6-polyprenyl-1,4-benzoquinol methylase UbiE [Bacteroidia bacterium]|nr:bifunctional demethylmenaquinone methyltransferase/2-methoxy-6-polyprenyl-1,4-benzoquinol methylase UbiE [Bacteroidia bacterium]MDW8334238.1 bifunctional demethylmenaquinone methyltransferase/2-methoxy-6-polyprenyl-1,4-benzoquinol methylase UbiE [Bacteroidia bacterium]